MTSTRILGILAAMLLMSQTFAASTTPHSARGPLKADEEAVRSAKEALDAAETAAGMTPTFPETHRARTPGAQKPTTTATPHTPGERIEHWLEHVQKEIAKVNTLLGQANLPSAVSSAANTLLTDLNKLQTDLQSAESKVGAATTTK
jgi:hypothetical protein